jgi:hypothetical protein
LAFDTATAGKRTAKGAADIPLTFTAATAGKKTAHGAATLPLTVTFDISGFNLSGVPQLLHFAQPTPGGGAGAGSPTAGMFAPPSPEKTLA